MNLKSRRIRVHSKLFLSIYKLRRVLADHSKTLPVLGGVSDSAATRDRAFGSRFAASSGVTAYRSLLCLFLITADAVSKSVRSICRASSVAWKTASSWCLLGRWKRLRRRKISTLHPTTLFISLFDDGLLRLVINHSKDILCILRRQLLPDEKALSPSLSRIRIGIRDTLLDVGVHNPSVPVKNSFKRINANKN